MHEHGLDYPRAVHAVGIDPRLAADPDAVVPVARFMQMMENVAREWDNDAFGVLAGETYPVGRLGVFDYTMANSPTLEVSLTNYARFHNLVVSGFETLFAKGPQESHIILRLLPDLGAEAQTMDAGMTAQVMRIRHAMQDPTFPLSVDLKRSPPRQIDEFVRVLGPRVRFGQEENRIGIANDLLRRRLPAADPVLYEVIEAAAEKAMSERRLAADPVARLASHLCAELPRGDVTLEMAAGALGQSTGALVRDLRQAGTTFKDVVNATRKSMADHYIKNSELPLSEIAFLLGFSELSAFSRAAKGWFGEPPREIRRQVRTERSG